MPPDRWLELVIRTTLPSEEISPVLMGLGGTAVEERAGSFSTYLLPPIDLEAFLAEAQARVGAIDPERTATIEWRWQSHEDWEVLWRRGLGPRKISRRITVAPTWQPVEVDDGEILLLLDPGMAFGTAEHATTRGCLRLMDSLVETGHRIADVGAGSGILSIAAARLGAAEVLALEMDEMSCETAQENVDRNGVRDQVSIRRVEVEGNVPLEGSPYDGIVANLQSHLLLPLLQSLAESLIRGGWLVVSGVLGEERDLILSAAPQASMEFIEADEEGGWWTGVFKRRNPSV